VEQPQRGVAGAVGQGIEVMGQAEQGAAHHIAPPSVDVLRREFPQQRLQLAAVNAEAIQRQHAQHPADAVDLFQHAVQRLLVLAGGGEEAFEVAADIGQRTVQSGFDR
jgi:hypothetical protein